MSSAQKIVAGGLGVADLGSSAQQFLDALRVFYGSPVLANTRRLLEQGHTDQARRYWRTHCIDDQSLHRDCEALRVAVSRVSSLLVFGAAPFGSSTLKSPTSPSSFGSLRKSPTPPPR